MFRCTFPLLAVSLLLLLSKTVPAEEIPLEACDRLPVIEVRISGTKFLFLIDTAATTVLNVQSFSHGNKRVISVTSWNETVQTAGQDVTVADLAVGQHHFKNLRLPAVDLSAIGRACGRIVSGILGIDLLKKLGATVQLNDHAPRLLLDAETAQAPVAELYAQLSACQQAFNRGDEKAFNDCLDPQVVIFTISGDYYGREAAIQYFRCRYFQHPPAQLMMVPRAHHTFGDAIWIEYDMRIAAGGETVWVRGSALCQEENGKWRIVHMNHSKVSN